MKQIILLICCLGLAASAFGQTLRLDSLVLHDNVQVFKPGLKQLGAFTAGPDTLLPTKRTLLPFQAYSARQPDPWVGRMEQSLKLEVYVSAEEKITEEILSASGTLGGFEYQKIRLTQNAQSGRWEGKAQYLFYLPSHVGEKRLNWNWQQKNGQVFGKTEVRLLTIAGKPVHPQAIPMLPVLEIGCRLGEGRATKIDLMAQMTKGAFHFLNQENTAAYYKLGVDFLYETYNRNEKVNQVSLVPQELLPALLHTDLVSKYDCRVAALFLVNTFSAIGVSDIQMCRIHKSSKKSAFSTQKIYHRCYQSDKQYLEGIASFNFHAALTTPLLDSVPMTLAMDPTFMLLNLGGGDINTSPLLPLELYLDHFVDVSDREGIRINSQQVLVANAKNIYHVPAPNEAYSKTIPLPQLKHLPSVFTSTPEAIELFTALHFVNLQPFGQMGMNYVWATPNNEVRLDMIHLDRDPSNVELLNENYRAQFSGEIVPVDARTVPGEQAWKCDEDFFAFNQGSWIVELRKNESTTSIDLMEMASQLETDLTWESTNTRPEPNATTNSVSLGKMKMGQFFQIPSSFFPWERIQEPRSHFRLVADNGIVLELENAPDSTTNDTQDLSRKIYFYPSKAGTVNFKLFLYTPNVRGGVRDGFVEVLVD